VAFRRRRTDITFLQHDITALVVLIGFDDVLPGHFLTGVGVDPFETDRLAIAGVEHAELQIDLAFAVHQ